MTTANASMVVAVGVVALLTGTYIGSALRTMSDEQRARTGFRPLQALGFRIMGWIGIAVGVAGFLGAFG